MPESAASRTVLPCDPQAVSAPIVFSALDSDVAGDVEPAFARAGRTVLSNAKNYRMAPDVPLVIPEVNADHLTLLPHQRAQRGWSGAIVTNANCAVTNVALALAPLHQAFGVQRVFIATMQAVSGAGYPGVPSLDILGNVIPFINDEEPKIEAELTKLLGRVAPTAVFPAPIVASAHANRVPVEHGHTACLSVAFDAAVDADTVRQTLRSWAPPADVAALPSAPERALVLRDEPDRPQARRDVHTGNGMSVVVGRIRPDPLFHVRLVALAHNVVRGAAGGSLLNAELLVARGLLPGLRRP